MYALKTRTETLCWYTQNSSFSSAITPHSIYVLCVLKMRWLGFFFRLYGVNFYMRFLFKISCFFCELLPTEIVNCVWGIYQLSFQKKTFYHRKVWWRRHRALYLVLFLWWGRSLSYINRLFYSHITTGRSYFLLWEEIWIHKNSSHRFPNKFMWNERKAIVFGTSALNRDQISYYWRALGNLFWSIVMIFHFSEHFQMEEIKM